MSLMSKKKSFLRHMSCHTLKSLLSIDSVILVCQSVRSIKAAPFGRCVAVGSMKLDSCIFVSLEALLSASYKNPARDITRKWPHHAAFKKADNALFQKYAHNLSQKGKGPWDNPFIASLAGH